MYAKSKMLSICATVATNLRGAQKYRCNVERETSSRMYMHILWRPMPVTSSGTCVRTLISHRHPFAHSAKFYVYLFEFGAFTLFWRFAQVLKSWFVHSTKSQCECAAFLERLIESIGCTYMEKYTRRYTVILLPYRLPFVGQLFPSLKLSFT